MFFASLFREYQMILHIISLQLSLCNHLFELSLRLLFVTLCITSYLFELYLFVITLRLSLCEHLCSHFALISFLLSSSSSLPSTQRGRHRHREEAPRPHGHHQRAEDQPPCIQHRYCVCRDGTGFKGAVEEREEEGGAVFQDV